MNASAFGAPLAGTLVPLADRSGEAAKAGPIGLVVIIVLCIVCYFLFKSMSKHMKRVREDWPVDGGADPEAPAPTDGVDSEGSGTGGLDTDGSEDAGAGTDRSGPAGADRPAGS